MNGAQFKVVIFSIRVIISPGHSILIGQMESAMKNRRTGKLLFYLVLVALLLAACGSAGEQVGEAADTTPEEGAAVGEPAAGEEGDSAEVTEKPEFIEITPEIVLLSDDFSDVDSGWDRETYDGGTVDYSEGGYLISVQQPVTLLWSNPGQKFSDVAIEVAAQLVSGGEDNTFGVICRYLDAENYYAFTVGSDGDYAIRKRFQGSNLVIISGEDFGQSEAILGGNEVNHLRAECIGDQLKLYANDTLLAEVTGADMTEGDVGVIAGTFEADSADILFSNFEVFRIPTE
jgi:hypothetical protein